MYLRDNEILLGQNKYDVVVAEIKDGKIRGFNTYEFIDSDRSYDGNYYLSMNGWCHEIEVNGKTYKSGETLPEITPHFTDEHIEEVVTGDDIYTDEGHFCSECGTFHSSEQYYDVSYVILHDCELYCKTCVESDDLIADTPVQDVDDIYAAKDITCMGSPEHFEEVETIFHDCGWGGPATNHDGAKRIVDDLLEQYEELYAALTGIGQFQVYVTLYKRIS